MVIYLERGADCMRMPYGPADATAIVTETPSSLVSFKSRLVLTFCYLLTRLSWKRSR